MAYTPSYIPPYEDGWEDLPLETTPITAEILDAYDDAFESIEDYLENTVIPSRLNDMDNVNISEPTNGQVLKYDSATLKWVNGTDSGGVSQLSELTDVALTTPTDGQVLKYDNATSKWINANESGGGSGKLAETVNNALGAKNVLPVTVDIIKSLNTSGTWSGNIYTISNVTFTLNTDSKGNVTSIKASGQASANVTFFIASRFADSPLNLPTANYTLNGCPATGSASTYEMRFQATRNGSLHSYGQDRGSGVDGSVLDTDNIQVVIYVQSGYNAQNLMFYPMIRLSAYTDSTFAPYTKTNLELTNEKADSKALAPVENGATASKAYSLLDYFYKDGNFCYATTAIAQGEALVFGSNYQVTDIAGILKTIPSLDHIYSTTEHEVGVWIDGKTIYEKTLDLGSAGVQVPGNGTAATTDSVSGIAATIWSFGISQSGKAFPHIGCSIGTDYIMMENKTNNASNVRWFTYQYTKV